MSILFVEIGAGKSESVKERDEANLFCSAIYNGNASFTKICNFVFRHIQGLFERVSSTFQIYLLSFFDIIRNEIPREFFVYVANQMRCMKSLLIAHGLRL